MKRIFLFLILLTWIVSSCGIFKKTNKSKEEFRASAELESVDSKKLVTNTQTTSGAVEQLAVKDRSTSSKSIRADRIRLLPDGSIEADGNAVFDGFDQKKIDSLKNSIAFQESNSAYYEDAKSRIEYEANIKEVVKTSESETDGVGVLFGAVAVLVVVFGVMWWLGIKKR